MNEQMQRIFASKQAERARLAALPFAEKLAILERLRDRTLAVRKIKSAKPSKVGQAFLPAHDAQVAQTGMSAPPLSTSKG